MLVKEVMMKDTVYAVIPGRRKEALEIMQEKDIFNLPVLKKGTKEMVGTVSLNDLLNNPEEDQLALIVNRNPVTVSPDDDIKKACEIFVREKIRNIPVVNNNSLTGILSVNDIVKKGVFRLDIREPCKKYMKTKISAVWENTPLNVVLKIMSYSKSLSVIVLNDSGEICGMVDREDIIKAGEVVSEVKKKDMATSEEDEWDWETKSTLYIGMRTLKLPRKPVKEYMTKDVVSVTSDDTITECAKKMRKYNIEQLPVTEDTNRPVGIIRDYDILKALIDLR
ncbi:MAG: CBS domain-containing protein [Methanomicrobia archaeon]|nr:CBS domain-containing protein [Methanomicrobia archaeon]